MTVPAPKISEEFLTLARLALGDKPQDVILFLNKVARRYRQSDTDGFDKLSRLLRGATGRSSALRREAGAPVPVDADSRLHLLRVERPSNVPAPILTPEVESQISNFVRERYNIERLAASGLQPTRSALFVGAPGVGKTMSARWIADQLGLPLFTLDLSAVMSSFLGRTGNNLRAVLDFAKQQDCVLLLDEFDAVAKRRDDGTEVGELKRLVTVLLQEIDEWPASGVLLAATNHPELLDPAIWRRFDTLVKFPNPSHEHIVAAIQTFFEEDEYISDEWANILSIVLRDCSYSDIQKSVHHIRRSSVLDHLPIAEEIQNFVRSRVDHLSHNEALALAQLLASTPGVSQRTASDITGVSRLTIRRRLSKGEGSDG